MGESKLSLDGMCKIDVKDIFDMLEEKIEVMKIRILKIKKLLNYLIVYFVRENIEKGCYRRRKEENNSFEL